MIQPSGRHCALIIALSLCSSCRNEATAPPPAPTESHAEAADYQGRWLVINYWAEWCAPCREEIPELNQLAAHAPTRIAVAGVNFDGLIGIELNAVEEAMGIAFTTLTEDPAAQFGYPRPVALPTTVLVNPEGTVLEQLQGPQTFSQLLALIDQRDREAAAQ